jgi:hypothetical protein
MTKTEILRLINNMTIYDKLELIAHLIHSDRIELSLEDRQAGVIYEQKESPQYDPVDAGINGCGIMLYVNVDEFEATAYRSSEIADKYGQSRLVSTPEKEKL